jgi:hypothetical protein
MASLTEVKGLVPPGAPGASLLDDFTQVAAVNQQNFATMKFLKQERPWWKKGPEAKELLAVGAVPP